MDSQTFLALIRSGKQPDSQTAVTKVFCSVVYKNEETPDIVTSAKLLSYAALNGDDRTRTRTLNLLQKLPKLLASQKRRSAVESTQQTEENSSVETSNDVSIDEDNVFQLISALCLTVERATQRKSGVRTEEAWILLQLYATCVALADNEQVKLDDDSMTNTVHALVNAAVEGGAGERKRAQQHTRSLVARLVSVAPGAVADRLVGTLAKRLVQSAARVKQEQEQRRLCETLGALLNASAVRRRVCAPITTTTTTTTTNNNNDNSEATTVSARQQVLQAFSDVVCKARSPAARDVTLPHFVPLLASLTHAEFAPLLDAIRPQMKRAPEVALVTLTQLLRHYSDKLGEHTAGIVELAMPHIAAKSNACQPAAIDTLIVLAQRHLASLSSVHELLIEKQLAPLLDNTANDATPRTGAARAIEQLSPPSRKSDDDDDDDDDKKESSDNADDKANALCTKLATLASKEKHAGVRSALVDALVAWTRHLSTLPAPFTALVHTQLQGEPHSDECTALLVALASALTNIQTAAAPSAAVSLDKPLLDTLLATLRGPSGFKAPLSRATPTPVLFEQSVIVTTILTRLAILNKETFNSLKDSLLLRFPKSAPINKNTIDAILAIVELINIEEEEKREKSVDIKSSIVAHALLGVSLYGAPEARGAAHSALERVARTMPTVLPSFVNALYAAVGVSASDRAVHRAKQNDDSLSNELSAHCIRDSVVGVLAAARDTKTALSERAFTRLLLTWCHESALPPMVRVGVRAPGARRHLSGVAHQWHHNTQRQVERQVDARALIAALRTKPHLTTDLSQLSNKKRAAVYVADAWRDAASDAIAVLALAEQIDQVDWDSSFVLRDLMPHLTLLMGTERVSEMSARDWKLLTAADNALLLDDGKFEIVELPAPKSASSNSKKGNSKGGNKSNNNKAPVESEAEIERREKLAAQTRERAQIVALVANCLTAIEALCRLFGTAPRIALGAASDVANQLAPLLEQRATSEQANRLLRGVAHSTQLKQREQIALAEALSVVHCSEPSMRKTMEASQAMETAVLGLHEATVGVDTPLEGGTLGAVLPLLDQALCGGQMFTVLDAALAVCELHAKHAERGGPRYPAGALITSLRHLLSSNSVAPRIAARARVTIEQLSHALPSSQLGVLCDGLATPYSGVRVACLAALRVCISRLGADNVLAAGNAALMDEQLDGESDVRSLAASTASEYDDDDDEADDDDDDADDNAADADQAALDALRLSAGRLTALVWLLRHSSHQGVATQAAAAWKALGTEPRQGQAALPWLGAMLTSADHETRKATAAALAEAVKLEPSNARLVLQALFARFRFQKAPPEADHYMDLAARAARDKEAARREAARRGQMQAAGALLAALPFDESGAAPLVEPLFDFLASDAFRDVSATVREEALSAGVALLDAHAEAHTAVLLSSVQTRLDLASRGGGGKFDNVRTGFVVLMGGAARHLPPSDPRVGAAMQSMLETLRTPSEAVQRAVARALALLVRPLRERDDDSAVSPLVDVLLSLCSSNKSYAERRGGAFGIAGLVRGLGMSCMRDLGIARALQKQMSDKKSWAAREGALFALERLTLDLGRLMEPFIEYFLPRLLQRFGDSSSDVREAALITARAVMGQQSGFGVRQVMPDVLKAMKDKAEWRQKCGAIELLGAMAYVQPRQLSICLPRIVPRLVELLGDTHAEVHRTARSALSRVGAVIRNDELQSHVPLLLKALAEPDVHAKAALDALLHTRFVHRIDAPSLSLVMPLLLRGLRERSTFAKRCSAQIAGNMTTLAEYDDLQPYLDKLLPAVRDVLFDPVPDSRATAAHALGLLAAPLIGTAPYRALLPWLRAKMRCNEGSVERAGAAQGLAHVCAGVADADNGALLTSSVKMAARDARSQSTNVREGALCFFVYAPTAVGPRLRPLLSVMLPPLLEGFADNTEPVRDAAQRAAKALIQTFAVSANAIGVLLPVLEEALFSEEWRVRAAAVALLGDLLLSIAYRAGQEDVAVDASAEVDQDEDDDDAKAAEKSDKKAEAAKEKDEPAKADPRRQLRELQTKLAQYSPDDDSRAAKALRREIRKLAKKCGVSPSDALKAAYGGPATGGSDDDDDDASDDDARGGANSGRPRASMSTTDRTLQTEARLRKVLDDERRQRVLASIYVMRADVQPQVTEAAIAAWKSLVSNTPKTLNEVVPTMLAVVVSNLSTGSEERRVMAGRTLAALVRKLGDRVLPQLLMSVRSQMNEGSAATRVGVAFALGDVVAAATPSQIESQLRTLASLVRNALSDEVDSVREAGGTSFDALYRAVGQQAIAAILPGLMDMLDKSPPVNERALNGVRNMLAARPQAVIPLVLPKLAKNPLTPFRAHAIAVVAGAVGTALAPILHAMLPPLLKTAGVARPAELSDDDADEKARARVIKSRERIDAALAAAHELCGAIEDRAAAAEAASLMLDALRTRNTPKQDYSPLRETACHVIGSLCTKAGAVLDEDDRERLLDELVRALSDESVSVQSAANAALGCLTSSVPKDVLPSLLAPLTSALNDVKLELQRAAATARGETYDALTFQKEDANRPDVQLPGICLPRGLKPLVPIVVQSLSYGTAEQRAAAADTMSLLASLMTAAALKPFAIQLVGPLIRVVADRFPAPVKTAILSALRVMLIKAGPSLKPFVTQLQATFLKAMGDPTSAAVRLAASDALSQLASTLGVVRVDTLLEQLIGVLANDDVAGPPALAAVLASSSVSKASADNVKAARDALLERVPDVIEQAGDEPRDSPAVNVLAGAIAVAFQTCDDTEQQQALSSISTDDEAGRYMVGKIKNQLQQK